MYVFGVCFLWEFVEDEFVVLVDVLGYILDLRKVFVFMRLKKGKEIFYLSVY